MRHSRLLKHRLIFVVALQLASFALHAASINLSILNPNRAGSPGDVETFQGTITNNTGVLLNSTDLFLDFSGYDPVHVTLIQVLGLTSFSIPDSSTSSPVDLFTFNLANSAGVPMTFPASVILQASTGDLSPTQIVSVSTAVPEPSSMILAGLGAFVLFVCGLRKRNRLLVAILLIGTAAPALIYAQVSSVQFVTSLPGVTETGSTLMVAIPIGNNGTVNATNVQVTNVTLQTAPLLSPSSFPVVLGTLAPAQSAVFQANFNATGLSNTPHLMTIQGTYQVGSITAGFTLNRFILLPVVSPGSTTVKTATVGSNAVSGAPFPHQPLNFDDDVNLAAPPVPTGPFVPGTPTPQGTSANQYLSRSGIRAQPLAAVTFNSNHGLGLTSGGSNGTASTVAEPSGARGGNVVFTTANWTAAYSTDGGNTFKPQLDPTTIFPNDAVGYCCDQIVQYVPSIDRFIWLLQGNGYRLASASPAQVVSSSGTAWTYWNLTPSVFGTTGSGFDYPDMSVGNNYLYISWDAGCSPSCNGGLQIARISLNQIQAGGTIGIDYTNQSDSNVAWGSHLSQDTGNEIFWAGHINNSTLRVFSLAEGSNTYFWRDIGISSWANNAPTSTTPDGNDWLAKNFNGPSGNSFPRNGVIGATRSGNQIWFAWSAGTDNNFQQPHVEMVTLDRNNNFSKVQQVQIWNNSYAFAYPALATNACTGEVGLSLEFGGNGNYENHVVGFWGDFVVYLTSSSNVGTTRFGDYVTLRQNFDPTLNGAFFDAFGYGLNSTPPPGSGTQTDVRYAVFGRAGACAITIR